MLTSIMMLVMRRHLIQSQDQPLIQLREMDQTVMIIHIIQLYAGGLTGDGMAGGGLQDDADISDALRDLIHDLENGIDKFIEEQVFFLLCLFRVSLSVIDVVRV